MLHCVFLDMARAVVAAIKTWTRRQPERYLSQLSEAIIPAPPLSRDGIGAGGWPTAKSARIVASQVERILCLLAELTHE
jgi:hypothetical protein